MANYLLVLIIMQLSVLLPSAAVAAIFTPAAAHVTTREPSVCGGDNSLQQCGAPFPSDFCCPASAVCLQLDSPAMTVLCCPAGQDCEFVSPISCDETAQNATLLPGNQLHSDPTMSLDECGDACCPVGATCHSGLCAIEIVTTTSPISSTPTRTASSSLDPSSASTTMAGDATSTASPSTATSSTSRALDGVAITDASTNTADDDFSRKSFVAGLFPGIVLGALIVALLIWCLDRRRRRSRKSHVDYHDHKHYSTADQLTDLTPDSYRRPTHMRSISEPISDPANGHRTDFVRGTPSPPRTVDPLNHNAEGYTATATGPITPARTPKIRALFSRSSVFQSPPSPQLSQLPSHLKRGTLTHSYTISPIRALRPKKSSHSLRRQMTADAAAPPVAARPQYRPRTSTGDSTETIKVLMPRVELEACTPDQRKQKAPAELSSETTTNATFSARDSQATWATSSSSPFYPEPIRLQPMVHETPTRVPASQARLAGNALGMPYGPSSYGAHGLSVSRGTDPRRQTTFSGFMEKAGIRPGAG